MNSNAHRTAEFDQLAQRTMNDWKVPGLAIAVVQAGEVYTKVNRLIITAITSPTWLIAFRAMASHNFPIRE